MALMRFGRGVDVDRGRVESLRAGHSFLVDVTDTEVVSLDGAEFREDPAALADADVVLSADVRAVADAPSEEIAQAALAAAFAAADSVERLVIPNYEKSEIRAINEAVSV